jgi:site-specific DNA recombinase
LPRLREQELENRLGQILKNIYIPDEILSQLEKSILSDKSRQDLLKGQQQQRLQQRLATIRHRIDEAYTDKLDGKISEELWTRKAIEWQGEEQQTLLALKALEQCQPERMLDSFRILELANKAYFLYLRQPPAEKAKLLKIVLLNCAVDAVSVYPTYRKPFDLIFSHAKNGEWRA